MFSGQLILIDMKKTPFLIIAISVFALLATFITSNLEISFERKAILFSAFLLSNVVSLLFLYFNQKSTKKDQNAKVFTDELDEKLALFQEVDELFGGSLNSADMFRLITSRINDIVPFSSSALLVLDEDYVGVKNAVGVNADKILLHSQRSDVGFIGKILNGRKAVIDNRGELDKSTLPYQISKSVGSSIGVPLFSETSIYGVLVFYHEDENVYDNRSVFVLEAISNRVSNTFQRSLNKDRTTHTSLTDLLTHLPNERAFYMLLEQQIAEAQRFMERRPLTILSIDLQNFNEINKKYGHIQGDQVLVFVAKLIKNQLRQMDILARIIGDEFLVILPTASEETTNQVIQRLYYTVSNTPFVFVDQSKEVVKLSFSTATFMKDGDTAEELVKSALRKKEIEKADEKINVLKFPDRFTRKAS
jgi:diguanylate cyclase (GGDEF)-like protein